MSKKMWFLTIVEAFIIASALLFVLKGKAKAPQVCSVCPCHVDKSYCIPMCVKDGHKFPMCCTTGCAHKLTNSGE
jgi:hypothetical protein